MTMISKTTVSMKMTAGSERRVGRQKGGRVVHQRDKTSIEIHNNSSGQLQTQGRNKNPPKVFRVSNFRFSSLDFVMAIGFCTVFAIFEYLLDFRSSMP